jgi:uncharacterized membrane protein YvlD (DUF360 family)
MTAQAPAGELTRVNRQLPPIVQFAAGSLAAAVIGGIYMASYFPSRPPLGLPITLLVVGLLLLGTALIMLARIRDFGWRSFRIVGFWTLLAYVIQAGMIGYAFVHNGARGSPLVVIILLLIVFAVSVPLMISFTVGRYQPQ